MPYTIFESRYKDQQAVTIESAAIRAQFLPGIGAKMSSLVYRPRNHELMVQRLGAEYLLQPYDGNYVAGECSGFDDMFPTIDECFYEGFPWQGTRMPDHGEVWSLPWDYAKENDRLHFTVWGVRFPYKLEKRAYFTEDSILRLDYRLTDLSPYDFGFLWAAHTMINLEERAELVLPPGVKFVVNVFSVKGSLGKYGDELPWPVCTQPDGTVRDLRFARPPSAQDADKYYIKGKMPEGWCALKFHASDFTLGYSFPVQQVPYLAILPNEGGALGYYNIFLEPCTASFDRPDVARLHKEVSTVKGKSTYDWHLNLTLSPGMAYQRVDEDGRLR